MVDWETPLARRRDVNLEGVRARAVHSYPEFSAGARQERVLPPVAP